MVAVITILYDVSIEYSLYIAGFYLVFWFVAMGMQYKAFRERRARETEKRNLPDSEDQMKWQKYQEEEDFFVLWTHQIKTPIAALNVLLQAKDVSAIACRQELVKIEGYVEMALGYTRYENMGNDLVLQNCDLEAIVKGVVKKYSTIFIYKHLAIKLEQLDYQVLTDEKWLAFVLEQVLSAFRERSAGMGCGSWSAIPASESKRRTCRESLKRALPVTMAEWIRRQADSAFICAGKYAGSSGIPSRLNRR